MKRHIVTAILAATVGAIVGQQFSFRPLSIAGVARADEGRSTLELAQVPSPTSSSGTNRTADRDDVEDGLTPEEKVNVSVYDRSNRSVVNITTRISRGNSLFSFNAQPAQGSGSGSVIDREGHVLTNYHVIEDAQAAMVTLFDGESYVAKLVGVDAPNDIAVLKIDAPVSSLFPVDLGNAHRLRVGQYVFAIGNPFGLERTLTTGVISSLNRSLPSTTGRTMKHLLQVDAALNRGNSGGPLLDSSARLIGMNTAIASPSGKGENTGIGFAIPVSTLRRVVPQLIEKGRVTRPDPGIAQVMPTREGLLIAEVTKGGPAEKAGLKGYSLVREKMERAGMLFERTYVDRSQADTIVAVDGQPIKSLEDFLDEIEKHHPGEKTQLTILRGKQTMDVTLVLVSDE